MTNLLKNILNVLPTSQQAAINLILEKKKQAGELTSFRAKQEEAIQIYNRIKSRLGHAVLNPIYAVGGSKISSSDINKSMEEIYIDLNALYNGINQLSRASSQQATSLDSDYQKSRAAIQKLITDASVFALRKKYPEFNEIKVIDFNSSKNETQKTPRAEVNPKTRLLELKPIDTTRVQLENRSARTTSIYTKTISPGIKGTISKSFPPEMMVDQKPETFWASMVMSDSPIYQRYERKTRTGNTYQIDVNGPITEVYFRFSHVERLNHVRILPFADYPVRILDVAYKPSASSVVFYEIDDFHESSTLDWEELNFAPIFANEVKITLAQENYKQSIYQLPQSTVTNTDIFQKIFEAKAAKIAGGTVVDSDATIEFLRVVDSYQTAINTLDELLRVSGLSVGMQTPIEYYEKFTDILNEVYSDIDKQLAIDNLTVGDQAAPEKMLEIRKFEYLLGIREVEMGYALYSPTCTYESEKYDSQATISEIQLEVDDRHTDFQTAWESGYRKTSVEWNVDLGNGRILPIHPRNQVDEVGIPYVKDERLFFDLYSGSTLTRLGSYYSTLPMLKKDGQRIPESNYTVQRQTTVVPQLLVTLTGEMLDPNAVYTADYWPDINSYKIDVLSTFNSTQVEPAEVFTETGPDNEINLSKFPFINYEVINLTGQFSYSTGNANWTFSPSQPNIISGQLKIDPTITDSVGNILHTGSTMVYGITGLYGTQSGIGAPSFSANPTISPTYLGSIDGVNYGYFIQIMDSRDLYEVSGFVSATGIQMKEPISITYNQLINWGASNSGSASAAYIAATGSVAGGFYSNYALGVGVKTDDQIFALTETTYVPLTVRVGGRDAKNITDYVSLQHPAFSIPSSRDKQYEFIQAGKKLYFNQPIQKQEIKVVYSWITDYVRLLAILRCNTKINPDVTPKVNACRILINNSVI